MFRLASMLEERELLLSYEGFTDYSRLAPLPRQVLVVNPAICFFHPDPQGSSRLPAEMLLDQSIVTVPSIDTLGAPKS